MLGLVFPNISLCLVHQSLFIFNDIIQIQDLSFKLSEVIPYTYWENMELSPTPYRSFVDDSFKNGVQ